MHAFLKLHHNCDAYMDVQKERKSTFLLHLKIGKKEHAACFLQNIGIAVVSECLCHLRAQYLVQSPNICSGFRDFALCPASVSNGMAGLFALSVLNIIQTVLVQLNIIPCDSAKA